MARQLERAAKIHKEVLEWNKRIETRKKLDDYTRLESAFQLNEHFAFIREKHTIPRQEILKKIDEDHQVQIHMNRLLNFYESLANGVANHIYDEDLIKSSRKTSMMRTFTSFKDYIYWYRNEIHPRAYTMYEKLIEKWISEENKTETLKALGKV